MHLPPPETTGLFHIVGIGGIGMSAIAEVMHTRGYRVQGSDLKDGTNLERLRQHGIGCLIEGHVNLNLSDIHCLQVSDDELAWCKLPHIPDGSDTFRLDEGASCLKDYRVAFR